MEIIFHDIVLRPWKIEDAPRLALIANNKRITDNLRDGVPNPYSTDDAVKWLNSIIPYNDPPKLFAVCSGNMIAGSLGLTSKEDVYRKNIEMGYFLAEELWGRGIMTKAITASATYAFRKFEIERIYAEVYSDNIGSRRALEKAGFKCEAVLRRNIIKNGVIKDSCIYSLLKENHRDAGIEIVP